ncbi:hypothetical protein LSH36_187g00029 [Paralvinella palmiformis]|uniref:Profilin n=1 Tax=Paralvinella palmiformis TaxID=53620 RepID=A0AAD9JR25_9ANNE|nr:hypothetical protein LSH36_187g00029 [Paralvinella palmiformis]
MHTSWQTYVDATLMGSGFVCQSAIFITTDRIAQLASSRHFEATVVEVKAILRGFTEPEYLIRKKIILNKKCYVMVKASSQCIIGKCHGGGCIVQKCRDILVIGTFESIHGTSCLSLMNKLTDYLRHRMH